MQCVPLIADDEFMASVDFIASGSSALASAQARSQAGTKVLKVALASQDQQAAAALELLEQATALASAAASEQAGSPAKSAVGADGRLDVYA